MYYNVYQYDNGPYEEEDENESLDEDESLDENRRSCHCNNDLCLRALIGLETAGLTFRMKQYSTSYSSHICYDYDSLFCFWVLEKRLTQENCFLFCKKYEKE